MYYVFYIGHSYVKQLAEVINEDLARLIIRWMVNWHGFSEGDFKVYHIKK